MVMVPMLVAAGVGENVEWDEEVRMGRGEGMRKREEGGVRLFTFL